MLEQIDDSLWLVEGGLVSFYGFPYPTRSVIARLASEELWVWSPVQLTAALREAVDALGVVRHLVSPNKIHHLFLKDWQVAYPEAQLWGPASTIRKRSDLAFREPLEDRPPAEWIWDIDQAWFTGSLFLDEVVFLHKPSRTVIVGDLIEAFSDEFLRQHWGGWKSFVARLDGITLAKPGAPRATRCWPGTASAW